MSTTARAEASGPTTGASRGSRDADHDQLDLA